MNKLILLLPLRLLLSSLSVYVRVCGAFIYINMCLCHGMLQYHIVSLEATETQAIMAFSWMQLGTHVYIY